MPNIREFQTPNDLSIRPDSRADESLANSGRRIAALYNQAGEAINDTGRRVAGAVVDVGNVAQKAVEHQEISAGAAESVKVLAALDARWNDLFSKAAPNDQTVGPKFREEVVEPTLEKLRDGFITEGGQRFAETSVEKYRNHFFEKTSADMSRLARTAVSVNIETLRNQLSNMAIGDPTSLKTSLGMVEHSIGAMVDSSPNLRGVDGAAMKLEMTLDVQKSIVKAAALGAIAANPEAGLKQFSGPEYSKFISGVELRQLEQQAKAVQTAQRVDQERQVRLQKQAAQEVSDARENDYFAKLHSDNPKERASVSAHDIATDERLSREARQRMVAIVDRTNKPETDAKISRATTVELFNRMRADDNADPVKMKGWIDDAYSAGNLSWGDRTSLIKEVEDRKTPAGLALAQDRAQFFKQYAGAIANNVKGADGKTEFYDPQMGSPKLYGAERDARRVEQDLKQRGLDPHLAYDPTSEYFLGKKVPKWRGSMQGDLTDKAASPANPPAGPVSVTTKDQYDKLPLGTRYIGKDGQTYEKR